jgi:hypothetical protein
MGIIQTFKSAIWIPHCRSRKRKPFELPRRGRGVRIRDALPIRGTDLGRNGANPPTLTRKVPIVGCGASIPQSRSADWCTSPRQALPRSRRHARIRAPPHEPARPQRRALLGGFRRAAHSQPFRSPASIPIRPGSRWSNLLPCRRHLTPEASRATSLSSICVQPPTSWPAEWSAGKRSCVRTSSHWAAARIELHGDQCFLVSPSRRNPGELQLLRPLEDAKLAGVHDGRAGRHHHDAELPSHSRLQRNFAIRNGSGPHPFPHAVWIEPGVEHLLARSRQQFPHGHGLEVHLRPRFRVCTRCFSRAFSRLLQNSE